MRKLQLIAAVDEKNGLGKNNRLAWKCAADLKWFSKFTRHNTHGQPNVVIMGARTFESHPAFPLSNRYNFVLTHSSISKPWPVNTFYVNDIYEAIRLAPQYSELFIIGGAQVYQQALAEWYHMIEGLTITHMHGVYDCDVFFPVIDTYWNMSYVIDDTSEYTRKYYWHEP